MRLALGFAPHSGWAIAVVAGGAPTSPVVLHRERVLLCPEELPRQVYHHVEAMPLEAAEPILAEVDAAVAARTDAVLAGLAEVAGRHGELVGVGIVGRPYDLPDGLDRILASHALLHAGEGDLYRSALLDAAAALGLPAVLAAPKATIAAVAPEVGATADALAARLADLRKDLGAPWQKDHQAATAAALLALALTGT